MKNKTSAMKRSRELAIWAAMIISAISIILAAWAGIRLSYTKLSSDLIARNIEVIGGLVSAHPELEENIVNAFVKEPTAEEKNIGHSYAQKYGYSTSMPLKYEPIMDRHYKHILILCLAIVGTGFAILILLHYFYNKLIQRRVQLVAEAAERIVEGDFSSKLPEANEGEFAKLTHQFNQMSRILEANIESSKSERIFLKNIISDISHQLKTPLSSLKIFNELLMDSEMDKGTQVQFYEKSEQQLERMEWLIKNLLKMARLEAGAIDLHKEQRSLEDTLRKVLEGFEERLEEKQLKLDTCIKEDISFSYDEEWLSEALSNILKNAIEHSFVDGIVEVRVSETPVILRIEISDTGEGISEEDLLHVFKRFYKGKNSIDRSGTGIGLALAKAIVESHGGLISARSKEGQGSTFTIVFPKGIV